MPAALLLGLAGAPACSQAPVIEPGSTLLVELRGEYVEAPVSSPLSRLLFGARQQPFVQALSTLTRARMDDRIDTVVLHVRDLRMGWAKAQELRDGIARVRAKGKQVVAVLEVESFSTNLEYYVATAAERIVLAEGTSAPLVGLAAEYLYLGGLWEKLGVEFQVAKVGRYKSAVESIAGQEMSDASREMANALLDGVTDQFVRGIAQGRALPPERVRALIDEGPVRPGELLASGLVDEVSYLDAVLEGFAAPVVEPDEFARVDLESLGFEAKAQVALVYGSGNVVSGRGGQGFDTEPVFAADTIAKALEDAAEDPEIDAIVLRIDSPGGSSVAAEQMWRATQKVRRSGKPLIASFSDVAASGGYYVGVGADTILASPGSITGSIGVFALKPLLGGLYDKLGIHTESLTRGKYADFYLASDAPSAGAHERLQRLASDTYALFLERVASGRDALDVAQVDEVAQGRVWTGEDAFARGLVDRLGGLATAVDVVRERLGLAEDADVLFVSYPQPQSLAEQLFELMQGRASLDLWQHLSLERALSAKLAELVPSRALQPLVRALQQEGSAGGAWLLPSLWVEIH